MLLTLLGSNSCLSVNKKAAAVFGLSAAAYISVLLTIYEKASRKSRLEGGYMRVDRNYIRNETTIGKDEQLMCDAKLSEAGVIDKPLFDDCMIRIHEDALLCTLTDMGPGELRELKARMKDAATEFKRAKSGAKDGKLLDVRCRDIMYDKEGCPELHVAMRGWIGAIGSNYGYVAMSKELLKDFEDELNRYTGGDLDKALEIVGIATTLHQKDVRWAIREYENRHRKAQRFGVSAPRVTEQESVSDAEIDDMRKGLRF